MTSLAGDAELRAAETRLRCGYLTRQQREAVADLLRLAATAPCLPTTVAVGVFNAVRALTSSTKGGETPCNTD